MRENTSQRKAVFWRILRSAKSKTKYDKKPKFLMKIQKSVICFPNKNLNLRNKLFLISLCFW